MSASAEVAPESAVLLVVGIGIQWAGQTTAAAKSAVEHADRVLYAVADGHAAEWIRSLNSRATSLQYPRDGRPRAEIYRAMAQEIVAELARSTRVCAVFYGSAAVLTSPAHYAVTLARQAGYSARLVPGVSFLDCLFCDLGVDPARGCQIYEASDLLRRELVPDPRVQLILCQPAMAANRSAYASERVHDGLQQLLRHLLRAYPPEHPVIIYEASAHPLKPARIERATLAELASRAIHEITTLYIPSLDDRSF